MRTVGFAAETLAGKLATRKGYPSDILRLVSRAYNRTAQKYGPLAFGKVFNHPDQLKVFLSGRVYEPVPITWSLAISWACNNACVLCTFGDRKYSREESFRNPKGLMSKALINAIIDQLVEYGAKGIIFTGGGEPTLHPDLLECMAYAIERRLDVGLFTNGTFDPAWATILLRDIRPRFIRVSLNAPDPVSHRKFHNYAPNVDNFEASINNIKTMAHYKYTHPETETSLGIGVIVGQENVDALAGYSTLIPRLLFNRGEQTGILDYLAFRPQVVYGGILKTQHPPEVFTRALTTFWSGLYPKLHNIRGLRLIFVDDRFKMLYHPQQKSAPFCVGQVFRGAIGLSQADSVPREKIVDLFGAEETSWPKIFSPSARGVQFQPQAAETILATLMSESRKSAALQLIRQTGKDIPAVFCCDEHNGDNDFKFGDLTTQTIERIYRGEERLATLLFINEAGYPTLCPPTCIAGPSNKYLTRIMGFDLNARHNAEAMAERISRACTESVPDPNHL